MTDDPHPADAGKRAYVVLEPVLDQFAGYVVLLTEAAARTAGAAVRLATPADVARFGRDPIDPAPPADA